MDNLPTVIMEAMAAGLPVISTPLGGIPEMVEHDVNGELVPRARSGGDLRRDGTSHLRSRAGRRLGDRGRQIAQEKFSIETSARR